MVPPAHAHAVCPEFTLSLVEPKKTHTVRVNFRCWPTVGISTIYPFVTPNKPHRTTSQNGRNTIPYGSLPHDGFWLLLGEKSCYKKSYRNKMGARTPHPIWTNAVGQRNGLIVRGRPYRTSHVLCHHIIINMGIDDDMIDVILNNQQNSGRP